jgi:hypothetical protein
MDDATTLFSTNLIIATMTLTCLVIAVALYSGLSQKFNLVFWRTIKLCSVLAGVISLLLLALAFDKVYRDFTAQQQREYANRELFNLRVLAKERVESSCSDVRQLEDCKRFKDFESALDHAYLGGDSKLDIVSMLGTVTVFVKRDESGRFLSYGEDYEIWRKIDSINDAIAVAAGAERSLEKFRRWALLGGFIVLLFSLAGSVGEAAFQLAQSRSTRNNFTA